MGEGEVGSQRLTGISKFGSAPNVALLEHVARLSPRGGPGKRRLKTSTATVSEDS